MTVEKNLMKTIRGDEKAFEELIKTDKNKLFRMAYLYVKNEDNP